jgi:hypothetical protein
VWPWLLIAFAVVLALAVAASFLRLTIAVNAQAQGDPSGAWAMAGGASVGPLTATAVTAAGVPLLVELRVFRWRVWRKRWEQMLPAPEAEEPRVSLGEHLRRLERWIDPAELAAFLLGEHKRAYLERLEIELDYSFSDVTITGMLFGGLAALDGMLPQRVVLRQMPRWEARDRAGGTLDGRVQVRPGLLACDAMVFAWRHLKLRRREAPNGDGRQAE